MRHDDIDTGPLRFTGRIGIWERDLATGAMRWNAAIDEILGFPSDRAGQSLQAMLGLVVPEDKDRVTAALETSLRSPAEEARVEYRCLRPDGREVVIRNEWSLGADQAGRPVVRGVLQDITHRRRANEALDRQTRLLALIYDVAKCANEAESVAQVLEASIERICTFGGFPFGHALLVSESEPRDLVPSGAWYAADPQRYDALFSVIRASRLGASLGVRGTVLRDGEPRWSWDLRAAFPPAVGAAAACAGLRAAFHLPVLAFAETAAIIECFADEPHPASRGDKHEMTHVAAQIGRVFERRKVDRMKDEFVSVVSHELRTPLTSIQGAIGLLSSGVVGPLSTEGQEMASIASEGCSRLLKLVNELLDIQKLESAAPTLVPEALPLGPLLAQVVASSRPHAAALGIRIDLDDAAPGAVVCADGDRLSQVVSNLLSNAVKYTPAGERIRVTATRTHTHVRVAVEDRGPGVPEEFRRRLFQKFSQADASDARQKGGTGLGLAICKVIVEKLGGTIAHEPILGGGARFYFELPLMDPPR